jgi:TetR/AcrR family transcriptional regulator
MAALDQDTETKIKQAAVKVFIERGYDGAKIRDIAEEAKVNIALINYYFRSKEQLFKSIYLETFRAFFGQMVSTLNEETSLEEKIRKIVDGYTDFLLANPLIPVFILSELRQNSSAFFKELKVRDVLQSSFLTKQLRQEAEKGNIRSMEPLQFVVSVLGNVIFPFVARPIISYLGDLDEAAFRQFMEERKRIAPEMIMGYLKQR